MTHAETPLLTSVRSRITVSCQNPEESFGDIIMYTYKAVNLNYYKYTVDGINVIVLSILLHNAIMYFSITCITDLVALIMQLIIYGR